LARQFAVAEDNEAHITINVISTLMFGILLIPKLRETAQATGQNTVLTFVGSWMHHVTSFPEQKSEHILYDLAQEKGARMGDRYQVSKLMELLMVRELADRSTRSDRVGHEKVIMSVVNPGGVATTIDREPNLVFRIVGWIARKTWLRTAEHGSRTLIHGAEGAPETHGQYLDECQVGT
jgi:retinol dehydrogenase 12